MSEPGNYPSVGPCPVCGCELVDIGQGFKAHRHVLERIDSEWAHGGLNAEPDAKLGLAKVREARLAMSHWSNMMRRNYED